MVLKPANFTGHLMDLTDFKPVNIGESVFYWFQLEIFKLKTTILQ